MIALQAVLGCRSHRDLELTARSHKLPFTRREAKAVGLAQLSQALHAGAFAHAFHVLPAAAIDALHALVAAGGAMPALLFSQHFGEIRPYRPWRKDFYPRHPWRYPASAAERLYQQAFIHLDGDMTVLVAEAAALLPPLPRPEADLSVALDDQFAVSPRSLLLRDVATLLGTLLRLDAQTLHGRWLSLGVLRELNAHLAIPDDLDAVRSELQSGRLRWLHYLAQVAGLLSEQGGVFKPTVAAWAWLAAEPAAQWSALMLAVEADLDRRTRLWDQFRLPEIDCYTWLVVRHTLDTLDTAQVYRVRDLMTMLKPYLIPDDPYEIALLLRGPLAWSGVLLQAQGRVYLYPRQLAEPEATPLALESETGHPPCKQAEGKIGTQAFLSGSFSVVSQARPPCLRLSLPHLPHLSGLVLLLCFARIEGDTAVVDAQSLKPAIRADLDLAAIVGALAELSQARVPQPIVRQLQAWLDDVQRLTLRQMVVLETADPQLLQAIRADWRLAQHFGDPLSPTQIAVVAEDAVFLQQRLARRHYDVTTLLPERHTRRITEALNSDMADYLLLAVRTYQQLHSRLDASIRIPAALTNWLRMQVTDPDALEACATSLTQAVQQLVPQRLPDAGLDDLGRVERLLRFAQQRGVPVTIDYYGPYDGVETRRMLEIDEIYEVNAFIYMDAFCHLAGEMRTFRLDRVRRVHNTTENRHELAG